MEAADWLVASAVAGLDVDGRRQRGLHACGELRRRDAGVGGDRDAAQSAGLTAPALHVLQAAGDDDGAAHRVGIAPREHAGDCDVLQASRGGDVEAVARLEALLVGEALDDADLVARLRLAPGNEPSLVEGWARVRGQQRWGAAGLDGLAVHDRCAESLVGAGGSRDTRHLLDLREHRVVQRLRDGAGAVRRGERRLG